MALIRDRSHESVINDTLARFLRERCSLSAVAETLHGSRRPDIIVRLSEGPVILETELEPALTVEADALSRLGMEIDGQKVQNVFAVTVPGRLRSTGQQHLYERMARPVGPALSGAGRPSPSVVPKPAPHTEAAQLWADVLDVLREQVTRPSFDTWLQDTVGIDLTVDGLTVSAPDWLTADTVLKRWERHVDDAVAAVRPGDAVAVRVVSEAKR